MVFSGISERGASGYSIHPICAVSDRLTGYQDLSKAYFTIEGEGASREALVELFQRLGNPVEVISSEMKVKYHAAAVFASNLVAGLYDIAAGMLEECGLSEEFSGQALRPLFLGNTKKIAALGAAPALSGPVERADDATVKKHLDALSGEQREIYRLLSGQLVKLAKQKNPDREYDNVLSILREEEPVSQETRGRKGMGK